MVNWRYTITPPKQASTSYLHTGVGQARTVAVVLVLCKASSTTRTDIIIITKGVMGPDTQLFHLCLAVSRWATNVGLLVSRGANTRARVRRTIGPPSSMVGPCGLENNVGGVEGLQRGGIGGRPE